VATSRDERPWNLREIVPVLGLLGLAAIVFLPSLSFGFLSNLDDFAHVTDNRHLGLTWANLGYWWTHPVISVYMPLTMYSYMFDHLLWELNPLGYHLQSVGWHLAATLLVYGIFRAVGIGRGWSWLAAALWAVHPQRVESVTWISERKDVMCAALYFGAVFSYLRTGARPGFAWIPWLLTVLALLCKPMAVSLPFVLMLIDFSRRRRLEWRYYLVKFWPYLAVAAAIMLLTVYYQVGESHRHRQLARQVMVILHNCSWYTLQTLWPEDQRGIYPRVWFGRETLLTMAAFYTVAAGLLAWAWRRLSAERFRYELLPMLGMYLVALAPIIGVFHLGFIDYADRYTYIPSVLLLLLLARVLGWRHWTFRWQGIAAAAAVVYLTILAIGTWNYQACWGSYRALLNRSISYPQVNCIVLCESGFDELERRNYPAVYGVADRLEAGVEGDFGYDLYAGRFYADLMRARVAYDLGEYSKAEKLLSGVYPALAPEKYYKPGLHLFILRTAVALQMHKGNFTAAKTLIDQLLKLYDHNPDKDYDFYYYRGLGAGLIGDCDNAERDFKRALELKPGDHATLVNLQNVARQRAAELWRAK